MRISSIAIGCLLASITAASHGQTKNAQATPSDALQPQGLLAVAKVTGACGIFSSMIQFQKATKMEGGDEFIDRFWKTEAARRGMTVQQIIEECNSAVPIYDRMWEALQQ